MKVETIFFDAGNTLCLINMNVVSEVLADLGITATPDDLWKAELRARHRVDDPAYIATTSDSERWFVHFRFVLEEAKIYDEVLSPTAIRRLRAYHDAHNLWNHLPPEVPPFLRRIRAGGYRLAVVSNCNGTMGRKLEEFGIAEFFEAVIDSHVEGVENPDARIFRIALERTGAQAESTIHVGDLYHVDVVGAEAAGITPVLLDPTDLHTDKQVHRIRSLTALESLLSESHNLIGEKKPS